MHWASWHRYHAYQSPVALVWTYRPHGRGTPAQAKRLLYGELQEGKRSVGGQRKRYKDTLKVALNNFQIDPDTWEDAAANRSEWRSRVAEGAAGYEEDRLTRAENKRRMRKTFSVSSSSTQSHNQYQPWKVIPCCHRTVQCRFHHQHVIYKGNVVVIILSDSGGRTNKISISP